MEFSRTCRNQQSVSRSCQSTWSCNNLCKLGQKLENHSANISHTGKRNLFQWASRSGHMLDYQIGIWMLDLGKRMWKYFVQTRNVLTILQCNDLSIDLWPWPWYIMSYFYHKVKVKGQDLGHYPAKLLKHCCTLVQNVFAFLVWIFYVVQIYCLAHCSQSICFFNPCFCQYRKETKVSEYHKETIYLF